MSEQILSGGFVR